MKFEFEKLTSVHHHLKQVSKIFIKNKNEYVMFCPFCNDATRKVNPSHGHLYISCDYPVFNCFRCSASGTLGKLLIHTEFDDIEILNYISSFIKYDFVKDFNKRVKRYEDKNLLYKLNYEFVKNNKQDFYRFKQYVNNRLGDIDYLYFLLSPGFLLNNILCCNFYNKDLELINSRLIDKYKDFRYKINERSSGLYYFQEMNFNMYDKIVLTEGPFDIINTYLYNNVFHNNFHMSISGKKYFSTVEYLILNYLLIGKYVINIVFDNDVKHLNSIIFKIRKFTNSYNDQIIVKGWVPSYTKDVGEFPDVREICL